MSWIVDTAVAVGTTTAAVSAWERSQWCTSQLLGKTLLHGPEGRELALTFDDGPNERYTQELLEKLASADVRATFFCVGMAARDLPWLVRQVHAAGHVVGNHTLRHRNLAWMSADGIRAEIGDGKAALEDILGVPVRFFRPPYGKRRPAVMRIARELGQETVMWNSMGYDWRRGRSAKTIMKSVERSIRSNRKAGHGSTILLHDGEPGNPDVNRRRTVMATGWLLERGRAAGYRFVTLDEWWGAPKPSA